MRRSALLLVDPCSGNGQGSTGNRAACQSLTDHGEQNDKVSISQVCTMSNIDVRRRLSRAMGPAGISTSETMTTFVDQVLSILRLITDRMSPAERAGAMQVDFGEIVSLMLRYVNRLHRDETTSRLKIKFSQLCEAVLAKGECIMLSNEGSLRNTILECLMEWSIEAQRVSCTRGVDL